MFVPRPIMVQHAVVVMIDAIMRAATLHTIAFGFAKMTAQEAA